MIKCDKDGFTISNNATAQDILTLSQAIHTTNDIKLRGGYVISPNIINKMVSALEESVDSYRKSIKEAAE